MKIYRFPNGKTYQYEEGEQPAFAEEVKTEVKAKPNVEDKAVVPSNKSKETKKK